MQRAIGANPFRFELPSGEMHPWTIDIDPFRSQTDALLRQVKNNLANDQTDSILIPGQIKFQTKTIRKCGDVPIPA